jgi:hypothetical protein
MNSDVLLSLALAFVAAHVVTAACRMWPADVPITAPATAAARWMQIDADIARAEDAHQARLRAARSDIAYPTDGVVPAPIAAARAALRADALKGLKAAKWDVTAADIDRDQAEAIAAWEAAGDVTATLRIARSVFMPALPTTLTSLNCWGNFWLIRMPTLPATLTSLDCSDCYQLHVLRDLPAGLQYLDCAFCHALRELGPLPAGMLELRCAYTCALPDARPPRLRLFGNSVVDSAREWQVRVWKQHAVDRARAAAALPAPALLYV